ncbi:GNAT family N-acetyltransferase [Halobacillus sp. A5]|uniref:GNAT family N-acetyltransferase n=1 Tax=Halobacillus sp. A5 TaxID=2880263 RepID=UPI0020A65419|nr:GNAT family N-acetyltransferase [Halobacillus sp. A5]MCP3026797.1 GNAT family N-acetyltransferase [Halobacillus sp. A5]
MNIKLLTGDDAKAYRELRLEALLTNPDAFLTTYEQEKQRPDPINFTAERLDSPNSKTVGAFDQDQLVGIATLTQERHPKCLHKGSIVGVYVTAAHRRSGTAEKMMKELIEKASSFKIEIIQIGVVTNNKPAVRLYEKLGFRVFATERHAIKLHDRYLDEQWMEYFI